MTARIRFGLLGSLLTGVAAVALTACGGDSPTLVPTATPTVPVQNTSTQPTPAPPTPTLAPTVASAGPREYVVEAGDTLGAIAEQFGVTVEAIAEANDIEDPNVIAPGQTLTIPAPAP